MLKDSIVGMGIHSMLLLLLPLKACMSHRLGVTYPYHTVISLLRLLLTSFFVVSQVVYDGNSSFMYHQPGFAFNPYQSMMMEGQVPFSPAYYPQYGAPSPMHFAQAEIGGENSRYDPTSAYMVPFAGYGGGNLSGNQGGNALASHIPYPQTMGILGPYDHNASQVKTLFFLPLVLLMCKSFV